nr:DUF2752 domain-containing protein [Cellulosimicrobium arenosum]
MLLLTGLECPGCGALRATHDLAHLDLAGAWSMNPLWVVLAPTLVLMWGWWMARAWTGRPVRPLPVPVAWVGLGVLVVFGVLRNVPALSGWLGPAA